MIIKNFQQTTFRAAAEEVGLKALFENENFRITYYDGAGDDVCLTFLGVGEGVGGISLQKEEFFGTASAGATRPVLFIFDKKRHWFHSDEANTILFNFLETFCQQRQFRRRYALGNSMGGYGALIATRYMHIHRVLAFSPQYSVDPSLVPEETRWAKWRKTIAHYDVRSVEDGDYKSSKCVIIHGDDAEERRHHLRFPRHKNLFHYIVPGADHSVVKLIKAQGLLVPLVTAAFSRPVEQLNILLSFHNFEQHDRPRSLGRHMKRKWRSLTAMAGKSPSIEGPPHYQPVEIEGAFPTLME